HVGQASACGGALARLAAARKCEVIPASALSVYLNADGAESTMTNDTELRNLMPFLIRVAYPPEQRPVLPQNPCCRRWIGLHAPLPAVVGSAEQDPVVPWKHVDITWPDSHVLHL